MRLVIGSLDVDCRSDNIEPMVEGMLKNKSYNYITEVCNDNFDTNKKYRFLGNHLNKYEYVFRVSSTFAWPRYLATIVC